MNSGTDTIRSALSSQYQRERQTNTIKHPQKEKMASRVGNPTPKEVATLLPKRNLIHPKLTLLLKEKIFVNEALRTFNRKYHNTMKVPRLNGQ